LLAYIWDLCEPICEFRFRQLSSVLRCKVSGVSACSLRACACQYLISVDSIRALT